MFVLDASTALAWLLPGQSTPTAERAFRQAGKSPVVVPALWLIETQHVVLTMVRQKKLSAQEAWDIRMELRLLSKRVDMAQGPEVVDAIWSIASDHMMSCYDAAYVELALRLDLPLASDDSAIRTAVKRLGLALL